MSKTTPKPNKAPAKGGSQSAHRRHYGSRTRSPVAPATTTPDRPLAVAFYYVADDKALEYIPRWTQEDIGRVRTFRSHAEFRPRVVFSGRTFAVLHEAGTPSVIPAPTNAHGNSPALPVPLSPRIIAEIVAGFGGAVVTHALRKNRVGQITEIKFPNAGNLAAVTSGGELCSVSLNAIGIRFVFARQSITMDCSPADAIDALPGLADMFRAALKRAHAAFLADQAAKAAPRAQEATKGAQKAAKRPDVTAAAVKVNTKRAATAKNPGKSHKRAK